MADVFISYHAESTGQKSAGQLVPKIAAALNKAGISCWYAERDAAFGRYASDIVNAINICKIFLLILEQGSNKSLYVEAEVNLAFGRMSRDRQNNIQSILPVIFKVDDCVVSGSMQLYTSIFHITDGTHPDSQRICELVSRIQNCLPILDSTLS